VPRYYNLNLKGRSGRIRVGRRSELLRDYVRATGNLPPRRDRLPLSSLKNMVLRGRIGTVKRDYRQENLENPLHYSVVRQILGAVAGAVKECPNLNPEP
jgi:hypothetical protein